MATRVHCVRQSRGGARQNVDVAAYSVWLVELAPFNGDRQRATWVKDAVTARLQAIFTEIASLPGGGRRAPRAIDLVWASIGELSARRPNECIVYFVPSYDDGLIHPFAAHPRGSEGYRGYCRNVEQLYGRGTPPHAGLTFEVRSGDEISVISEVHVDRTLRAFPNASNADLSPAEQERHCGLAGRGIGGMAFHELMHNVIDYNEGEGFELHDQGGIAAADGHSAETVRSNLARFRRYMTRAQPAQAVPSGRPPRLRAASSPRSGSGGPAPIAGLEGL